MWNYHTSFGANIGLSYSQPANDTPLDPEQINNTLNILAIQKMQAEIQLIASQIGSNNSVAFNQKHAVYLGFIGELRNLALAMQVDIEKTIMDSEPKYKPLYDGDGKETLIEVINKTILKLKTDLDIK